VADKLTIYSPSVGGGLGKNVFGKDVANHSLFRSLVLYGGLNEIEFLNPKSAPADQIRKSLIQDIACKTKVTSADLLKVKSAIACGTMLRGTADLIHLAWERRRHNATQDYSLIGLIHTIAPPSIREYIGQSLIAPVMPYDALICTSPSVQTSMNNMFNDWHEYLGARFGSTAKMAPMLPLIPLGVEAADFAESKDTQQGRATIRAQLNVADDHMLVLWVGRLSYFEKAFPQPMMLAIEAAAKASGKTAHFAMAGWFPDGEIGEKNYREAARVHAPNVTFHIIDGNDKAQLRRAWAGADVFISLVDNIQETFGITPIEAMASGLPVVVSDWDGYSYTVRDGIDGFLIPTLIGSPNGASAQLAAEHTIAKKTYQQYVGIAAQHTAVNVPVAAARLAQLFNSRELRMKMGVAGRQRILDTFDWRVVAPQYVELATELGAIRRASKAQPMPTSLVQGHQPSRSDPFAAFANFATSVLTDTTILSVDPQFDLATLDQFSTVALTTYAGNWRLNDGAVKALVKHLKSSGPITFAELMNRVDASRSESAKMTLLWLAKMGVVVWR
jgi:D-inositol-3-phosphate glycosyltransferase